ncbi:MAG: Na+/H+ antiporter subunit E [Pirellulales bacterium]|nr:Na+/H+ antiporter subunit E [Pirellulales bacterium]
MKPNYYTLLALKTGLLTLIWCALSSPDIFSESGLWDVVMGAVAAFTVAWLNTERKGVYGAIRVGQLLGYCLWLAGSIFRSGCHLSLLILNPRLPINPKMIRHRCELSNDSSAVLLANSITLTPGTITVELDSHDLIVHTIDDSSAADVTDRHIERKIDGLFSTKGMS